MLRRATTACPVRSPVSPQGLTLLEVLLAVSLTLILVSAIYSAVDQAWRLTEINRIEMERNQIARAVLRRIELDLRSAMFTAQAASSTDSTSGSSTGTTTSGSASGTTTSNSSSSGSTGSSSTTTTNTTNTNTTTTTITVSSTSDSDAWTGSLGIRGTSTELWIDLSYVRRNLEFQDLLTTPQGSDLQTVAYFLSNSDLVAQAQAESGATASPITFQDDDGVGLVRSQGERSVLRALNSAQSLGETVVPGPLQMIAPEVQWLQFRYFDGLSWYDEWDSSTIGSLPRAVEVTIGFEPPPVRTGFLLSPAVNPATDSYRLVVAIPVSDPLLTEDTF